MDILQIKPHINGLEQGTIGQIYIKTLKMQLSIALFAKFAIKVKKKSDSL